MTPVAISEELIIQDSSPTHPHWLQLAQLYSPQQTYAGGAQWANGPEHLTTAPGAQHRPGSRHRPASQHTLDPSISEQHVWLGSHMGLSPHPSFG